MLIPCRQLLWTEASILQMLCCSRQFLLTWGVRLSHLLTCMDLCSRHNIVHNVGPFNAESPNTLCSSFKNILTTELRFYYSVFLSKILFRKIKDGSKRLQFQLRIYLEANPNLLFAFPPLKLLRYWKEILRIPILRRAKVKKL